MPCRCHPGSQCCGRSCIQHRLHCRIPGRYDHPQQRLYDHTLRTAIPPRPKPRLRTIGDGLAVRRSGVAGAGRGLFATRPIQRGEWITGYTGELIDQRELAVRTAAGTTSHIFGIHHRALAVDGRGIPARRGIFPAAFCNDAHGTPNQNNAVWHKWETTPGGVTLPVLKATVDIPRGHEIFVSYGRTYWIRAGEGVGP